MTTETPQAIVAETARQLDVPADTVQSMFDFIDRLREQHGERWRTVFPCELLELVKDGEPWAADVLGSMARMIEGMFRPTSL